MATQSRTPISRFLGDEFNNFLFANVCNERNGRVLTVVSMLARLDRDPWAQAAGLARMPRSKAIGELAETIAGLAESTVMNETPTVAATRLVDILPGPKTPKSTRPSPWQNIMRKWRASLTS